MLATRDELIADWQKRLAASSDIADESPSRAAWLARLRQRLYHFLLSLYGDGRWNAPSPIEMPTSSDGAGSVVFDAPDALPLGGKPAKSDDKIRSVLDAVASANTERPEQGPLAGVTLRKLIVIVTARSGLDLVRCAQLLANEGLVVRCGTWNGADALYVPDVHTLQARELIGANATRLRLPPPAPIPNPSPALIWVTLGIACAPFMATAAAMFTVASYPNAGPKGQLPEAMLYGFAVFLALLSILYVRPIGWLIQWIDRAVCSVMKAVSKRRCSGVNNDDGSTEHAERQQRSAPP